MDGLTHALMVQPDGPDFTGTSAARPAVYGGQLVAQALLAAAAVTPGKACHSLHACFLQTGTTEEPIRYRVEPLREGRSYAARRITAAQRRGELMMMTASFQSPEDGPAHQALSSPVAAAADTLADLPPPSLRPDAHPAEAWAAAMTPTGLEVRRVDPQPDGEPRPARTRAWFRAPQAAGRDLPCHQAALAYASDYLVLEPALLPHGFTWREPGLQAVSLDHAIWFHRAADFSQWHLFDMEAVITGHGRALARIAVFDAAGSLVASVAQEGTFRLR